MPEKSEKLYSGPQNNKSGSKAFPLTPLSG